MLKQMTDEIMSVSDDSLSQNLVAIIVLNLVFYLGTKDVWVAKVSRDERGGWLLFSLFKKLLLPLSK